MRILLFGLAIFFSQNTFSSALVKKNTASKKITVFARMVYSGSALTDTLAASATEEIDRMWNESPTEIALDGTKYSVEFVIDYQMPGQALKQAKSCALNFIQILDPLSAGDRSYYRGLGSQYGVFYTSDEMGISTTAAHEFGHGLKLDHNPGDQRRADVPGIMFARGTLVRQPFQWDPAALPGKPGGSLKPHNRKVRSEDINAIPFQSVVFGPNGLGCIGDGQALKLK